jgi:hypothetical protein
MTRLPADSWAIDALRGPEWPPYRVGPVCALQGCSSINVQAHHIVRRSFMAGAYDWVKIDGKDIVGNLLPLCWKHHQQVTENRTRIVWDEKEKLFWWRDEEGELLRLTQPPTIEAVRAKDVQVGHEAEASCPTCHQKLPRPKLERNGTEPRRPRKTWTITVPNDAREMGADVLDTLLESSRLILDDSGLSYGEGRGVRYFVLSTALGIFVAQADSILSDG